MILHDNLSFRIYFGDAKDCCVKSPGVFSKSYFEDLRKKLNLQNLFFLKQIHSSTGLCLNDFSKIKNPLTLFEQEGDFIITNFRDVGIGVLTADCLPVIFYDPVRHTLAIAHVGWRGAFSNIVENVIQKMNECFKSKPEDLYVYLGPSAKVCCYKVDKDFLNKIKDEELVKHVFFKKDNEIFFNLPRFVKFKLKMLGVKANNINKDYNSCTICDLRFHSYRRSGKDAGRQATIVVLK